MKNPIVSTKNSYSAQNHTPIHTKVDEPIFKTTSETSKIDFKTRERLVEKKGI